MRKAIFSITLILFSVFSFSQKSPEYIWSRIVGYKVGLVGTKMNVEVDFGKQTKFFLEKKLLDSAAKPIVFETPIDALNYMTNEGWEFVQVYPAIMGNPNISFHYYLMKKPFDKLDEETKQEYLKEMISK